MRHLRSTGNGIRHANETGGGNADGNRPQTREAIQGFLLERGGVSRRVIEEVLSMPAEVQGRLVEFWDLCKVFGFDSRQVAVFRAKHSQESPDFEKYADLTMRQSINQWKSR